MALGQLLYKRNRPEEAADCAVVFGTGLGWKAAARWEHAAKLYHQGAVRKILVSGGVQAAGLDKSEAVWFHEKLVRLGVPTNDILLESKATNAAENVELALPIIQEMGFSSVVLVMSDFAGLRAHLTAKRAWLGSKINIYNDHAPSEGHWSPWTWWASGEGRQLTWYVVTRIFRYGLIPYMWKAG
ncbi:MAG: YdcF family protein [Anaerolineae bacterium]|nr:YdcF family protein [Anaerolineae bacterium]